MSKHINEIASVSTDYPNRPEHRGHTVEIQGWNDEVVMLVIRSATHTQEAIISPAQLRMLADAADDECHKW